MITMIAIMIIVIIIIIYITYNHHHHHHHFYLQNQYHILQSFGLSIYLVSILGIILFIQIYLQFQAKFSARYHLTTRKEAMSNFQLVDCYDTSKCHSQNANLLFRQFLVVMCSSLYRQVSCLIFLKMYYYEIALA